MSMIFSQNVHTINVCGVDYYLVNGEWCIYVYCQFIRANSLVQVQPQPQLQPQPHTHTRWTSANLHRHIPSINDNAGNLVRVDWPAGTSVEYAPRPEGGCRIRRGSISGWVPQNASFAQ